MRGEFAILDSDEFTILDLRLSDGFTILDLRLTHCGRVWGCWTDHTRFRVRARDLFRFLRFQYHFHFSYWRRFSTLKGANLTRLPRLNRMPHLLHLHRMEFSNLDLRFMDTRRGCGLQAVRPPSAASPEIANPQSLIQIRSRGVYLP